MLTARLSSICCSGDDGCCFAGGRSYWRGMTTISTYKVPSNNTAGVTQSSRLNHLLLNFVPMRFSGVRGVLCLVFQNVEVCPF